MSQHSDYEQYDDSFSDSDNDILQSAEAKSRSMKAGYSSFADQEDLMGELSNALDSKNDSPKQQSKKLKNLLKHDKLKKEKVRTKKQKTVKTKKKKQDEVDARDHTVFGVSLITAVHHSQLANDGIELPTVFRECIDFLEELGLEQEGIYRLSGMKSKIEEMKSIYDKGEQPEFNECDPNVIASLLKQYLRELPDSLLTSKLQDRFEQVTRFSGAEQLSAMKDVLADMPYHNRLTLGWLMVHMCHIVDYVSVNKMGMPNIIIVLSPTLQTSPAVLAILMTHVKEFFSDVIITKFVRPTFEDDVSVKTSPSLQTIDKFETAEEIRAEISRQGSILQKLHGQMTGKFNENEDYIWELQRNITNLRRKLKAMKALTPQGPPEPVDAHPEDFLVTLLQMEYTLLAERDVLTEANDILKREIKREAELIEECKVELSRYSPINECQDLFGSLDASELGKQAAALKWKRKELQVKNSDLQDSIMQERTFIKDLNIKLRLHDQTATVS